MKAAADSEGHWLGDATQAGECAAQAWRCAVLLGVYSTAWIVCYTNLKFNTGWGVCDTGLGVCSTGWVVQHRLKSVQHRLGYAAQDGESAAMI